MNMSPKLLVQRAMVFLTILYFLTAFCLASHSAIAASTEDLDGHQSIVPALAPNDRTPEYGKAWIYNDGRFKLGVRDESCQCFQPNSQLQSLEHLASFIDRIYDIGTCCLSTVNRARFCIATDSTCCQNTFCSAKEACCGVGRCCPEVRTLHVTVIGHH